MLYVSSVVRTEIEARESRDVASDKRGSRLGAKDLMTKVKHVLSCASIGLSLLDRVQRDSTVREDQFSLLRDLNNLDVVDTIVENVGNKRIHSKGPDMCAALPKWDE